MVTPILQNLAAMRDRFAALQSDGVWTVWDAECELAVVHEAVWDESAARHVAESLNDRPGYVHLWTWSATLAEVG
jgi:hypothetical protein